MFLRRQRGDPCFRSDALGDHHQPQDKEGRSVARRRQTRRALATDVVRSGGKEILELMPLTTLLLEANGGSASRCFVEVTSIEVAGLSGLGAAVGDFAALVRKQKGRVTYRDVVAGEDVFTVDVLGGIEHFAVRIDGRAVGDRIIEVVSVADPRMTLTLKPARSVAPPLPSQQ